MSSIARCQDWIARHLGLETSRRSTVIEGMLQPRPGDSVGYWLQLTMATALATLGLALDSTAVVIGAMLIAPLMRPIVELAMGLATGSARLVFRAGFRSIASIVVVTAAAATISWLLPFHEITRELAARTAPSLIDLFVAAACALAGAYATMFASSDMASTAAGTSIGISLVPPLCTVGYALSMGDWHRAAGAGLLFTANITGIITVAGLVFVVVGFGQVDVTEDALATSPAARGVANRIGRNWTRASKRLGAFSRLVLPLLLLAGIFVPLRRAVGEMTRRSELRKQLESLLADTKVRVAQSSIEIGLDDVVVRVVIVGDSRVARQLDTQLRDALAGRLGDAELRLSVWAVPDAKALGALATRIDELPPPVVVEPLRDLAHHTPTELLERVQRVWPKQGTGALVSTWMEAGSPLRVQVVHLGAPLGDMGRELLQHALAPAEDIQVAEVALDVVAAAAPDGAAWLAGALRTAEQALGFASISVCIEVVAPPPPPPPGRRRKPAVIEDAGTTTVRDTIERTFLAVPRVTITRGSRWSVTPVLGACAPAADATSPGGEGAAAQGSAATP